MEDFVEGGRSLGWINLMDSITVSPNEVEIVDCRDQIEEGGRGTNLSPRDREKLGVFSEENFLTELCITITFFTLSKRLKMGFCAGEKPNLIGHDHK
jgi:hypothetical protein